MYLIARAAEMHFTLLLMTVSLRRKRNRRAENPHVITEHSGS